MGLRLDSEKGINCILLKLEVPQFLCLLLSSTTLLTSLAEVRKKQLHCTKPPVQAGFWANQTLCKTLIINEGVWDQLLCQKNNCVYDAGIQLCLCPVMLCDPGHVTQ